MVSEFSKDQLDTMITDALKISKYDFSSLVYVRVLLEIEVCKLCASNRTEEDLENIEKHLSNWKKSSTQSFALRKILLFIKQLHKVGTIR